MVNNIPKFSDENMSELNLSALGLLEQILDQYLMGNRDFPFNKMNKNIQSWGWVHFLISLTKESGIYKWKKSLQQNFLTLLITQKAKKLMFCFLDIMAKY